MSDDEQKTTNHTPIKHLIDEPEQVSYSKEGEPMSGEQHMTSVESVASEKEPHIEDKELEKYFEVTSDEVSIHPDLKKAGLQSIESTSLDPKQRIHLPIPDDKVMDGLEQPISSSYRWLAELSLFMLKRAHLSLKRLHGHVVRIIQK